MLSAALVLPHPPLLVPEVASGAADELTLLRAACDDALAEAFGEPPDRVVLVGAADAARAGEVPNGAPTLAPYGMPGPPAGLPLALTIGWWLLDRVGWAGPREPNVVAAAAAAAECAALGRRISHDPRRTLLIAMGDGTARRSAAAPGHLDERAAEFDAGVAAALRSGDAARLLALDQALAAELLVAGRGPWQVLAGASPHPRAARLLYEDAPYGVAYFVACWRPGP